MGDRVELIMVVDEFLTFSEMCMILNNGIKGLGGPLSASA